ncbi:7-cyano-7-deazaguanine synthase [Olivibacter domesticus]|uniref:7-cyano-7-deazaguanine synthase n=1 Tax=Olivibacter domesticus TaxID=407022 RepID=A0A1H7GN01_OLID1|nr:7-cyano-7-deazaguanine synthase [Olivibacter domesticus]SEK39526.1 7-cyano-7-deazaguanine synthase [Olivibacter domesticus]
MSKGLLLSGGLDSISLAYMVRPEIAFTVDYGQKPAQTEIKISENICKILKIRHEVIVVDCSSLGSGDLTNNPSLNTSPSSEWWPYRNQLLVTLVAMRAISLNVRELLVGSVRSDNFHKDGTIPFYQKLDSLMQYQEGNMKILYPVIDLYTHELIITSGIPLDMILMAHSCHTSNEPCGFCRGCLKYLTVKQKLNIEN